MFWLKRHWWYIIVTDNNVAKPLECKRQWLSCITCHDLKIHWLSILDPCTFHTIYDIQYLLIHRLVYLVHVQMYSIVHLFYHSQLAICCVVLCGYGQVLWDDWNLQGLFRFLISHLLLCCFQGVCTYVHKLLWRCVATQSKSMASWWWPSICIEYKFYIYLALVGLCTNVMYNSTLHTSCTVLRIPRLENWG